MAVPKNFNQIDKRVESLNDLTFYRANYEFEYTEQFKKGLEEGDDKCILIEQSVNGVHDFTALDDELADKKINNWLISLVDNKVIEEFEVTDMVSMSFSEKIKEKKLDTLLK
jgi:hypothetical protein